MIKVEVKRALAIRAHDVYVNGRFFERRATKREAQAHADFLKSYYETGSARVAKAVSF